MLRRLLGVFLLLMCSVMPQAQIVINEIMQSNIDCVMDDLNDFPDSWVELYNTSDHAVSLSDYKIGISEDEQTAWALPERILQSGEHILIYCDKVGNNTETGIHTDFRLESGKGGSVFLFRAGIIEDQLTELKKQPAPNVAYGRKTDGDEEWGYMMQPTPCTANSGSFSTGILGDPVFSCAGCMMQEGDSMRLYIAVPQDAPEGTVVRFTTNCSEPTASSPVFTDSLTVSSNTVVRAKLFCDGWLSPRSSVQSYLFFPLNRSLTLSVVSLVTDSCYLYDDQIGIYVDGAYQNDKKNYEFDWRRPVNFEFFEGMNQPSVLNQLAETRTSGGATRMNERKSLIVYANKRFGKKRLNYEFFPDQRPGVTDFKSLMLRNAGNDFSYLYLRDGLMQRVMSSHADLDWQSWRPAIVYINGEYTGLLNIRERANEDNVYTHYDGLEDIDLIENWTELKQGTIDQNRAFRSFFSQPGHTLEEYRQWMDCEEFANLMIMNLYFDNRDFPANNIIMWRPREEGGRWRWIAKDTDYGLGLFNRQATFNTIAWINDYDYDTEIPRGNTPWHTLLFRNIMEDVGFRNLFTERAAIYMGDFLNSRGVHAVWDAMYETIRTELPFHRACISSYQCNYEMEVQRVDAWLAQRTELFYQFLQEYYHLETLIPLVIDRYREDDEPVEIRFNGIRLSEGIFDGKFYQGREVTLQGSKKDGDGVAGWEVTIESESGDKSTSIISGNCYVFNMPECSKIIVRPLVNDIPDISPQEPVKAIISIIDDDTLQPTDLETLHQVCTDNDIVATFACITSREQYYPGLFDLLHSYEDEGFQVVLHCHKQKNYYRWTQNMDMTVTGVTKANVGDKYSYTVGTRVCPLTVEEVHLDADGNGHIYFDYMQRWYPVPDTQTGELTLTSGKSDASIAYSDFQVRDFRDNELVSEDMDTALGILADEGFKDYEYFVSPYGSQDEGLQKIAREHGLKCLVSISSDDYLRNDNQYTPFNIPRVGFNATDGGTSTMSRLKEHIDAVSVSGGWLLVGTHIYNGWTEELLQTRFKEFVDYAKEKGLQFVTLKDGFDIYSNTSGNENFSPVPTAVKELKQEDTDETETAYRTCYDITGRNIGKPRRGLNIIRMKDGTTKKLLNL